MIYKYISNLSNMQRRLFDKLAKDKAYSGTEGKVIHYLFENEGKPVYQKNIETVFALRAATATQVIDSLEKRGLVQRIPCKTDGRFKEIILTEKADVFKDDVSCDIDFLEKQIVRGIEPEELRVWCEISKKMIDNLKEN